MAYLKVWCQQCFVFCAFVISNPAKASITGVAEIVHQLTQDDFLIIDQTNRNESKLLPFVINHDFNIYDGVVENKRMFFHRHKLLL